MRILGEISVYGRKVMVDRLNSYSAIQSGRVIQLGLKRKIPDTDSWVYCSPMYQFNDELLDEQLYEFLLTAKGLEGQLLPDDKEVVNAELCLIPVEQTFEETFYCFLRPKTLSLLSSLGLSLEVEPESVMPEFPLWEERNK
jgi:hypothetical protein